MDNKMKVWSAWEARKILMCCDTTTQVRRHVLLSETTQVLFLKLTQIFKAFIGWGKPGW